MADKDKPKPGKRQAPQAERLHHPDCGDVGEVGEVGELGSNSADREEAEDEKE